MAKHAQVRIGEYEIPLIGIPPKATEYTCDLCGDIFRVEALCLNDTGNQFLCEKCRTEWPKVSKR